MMSRLLTAPIQHKLGTAYYDVNITLVLRIMTLLAPVPELISHVMPI